jgi:hypothetical protein
MRRRVAWFIATIALVAGGVLALPADATAQATIVPFSISFQDGPKAVDDTCAGRGVVGILTGRGTLTGQVIVTNHTAVHRGILTFQYRVQFPDGSYLLASQREQVTFTHIPRAGTSTFGGTLLERGTLYDAAGKVIGYELFHHRFRITVVRETLRVEFDTSFITCR